MSSLAVEQRAAVAFSASLIPGGQRSHEPARFEAPSISRSAVDHEELGAVWPGFGTPCITRRKPQHHHTLPSRIKQDGFLTSLPSIAPKRLIARTRRTATVSWGGIWRSFTRIVTPGTLDGV